MKIDHIAGLATGGTLCEEHRRALAAVLDLLVVANGSDQAAAASATQRLTQLATVWTAIRQLTTDSYVCLNNYRVRR